MNSTAKVICTKKENTMINTTEIFHIDSDGVITSHSTYGLPPKKALKCAVLQNVQKRFDTWNYDKVTLSLSEINGRFIYQYGDNKAFFTKRFAKGNLNGIAT